jgi:hypothetical protein
MSSPAVSLHLNPLPLFPWKSQTLSFLPISTFLVNVHHTGIFQRPFSTLIRLDHDQRNKEILLTEQKLQTQNPHPMKKPPPG